MEEETQLSREHALLGNYDAAVKKHTTLVRRLEGAGAGANEAHIALTQELEIMEAINRELQHFRSSPGSNTGNAPLAQEAPRGRSIGSDGAAAPPVRRDPDVWPPPTPDPAARERARGPGAGAARRDGVHRARG